MDRQLAVTILFFVLGLVLSLQTSNDLRDALSRLGVSILAGSFFFFANTSLQRGQFRVIAYTCTILGGLMLMALGVIIKIFVFKGS